jgi:hypothetical protein
MFCGKYMILGASWVHSPSYGSWTPPALYVRVTHLHLARHTEDLVKHEIDFCILTPANIHRTVGLLCYSLTRCGSQGASGIHRSGWPLDRMSGKRLS